MTVASMRWWVLAGLQLKLMPTSPCSWGVGPGAWTPKNGLTDTLYTCKVQIKSSELVSRVSEQ